MKYTIKPEKHELEEIRSIIDQVTSTAEAFQDKEKAVSFGVAWDSRIEPVVKSNKEIVVRFNTDNDDWQNQVRGAVARGYAQSWFLENVQPEFHWQELLMLGHSLHFSEKVTGTETVVDEKSSISNLWKDMRDNLSLPKEEVNHELVRHGFSTSYYLVEQLLENHEMEELPDLNRSEVIKAGNKVFETE
jgi:hypothetical protein